MTATTRVRLPVLGRAAQDELLDVCRRATATARWLGRPVLASWATPLRRADPVALWNHGRARTDRSLLWQSAWNRSFLVALGTAHDLTVGGDGRITDTADLWRRLTRNAVTGGHPGDWLPDASGPLLVGGFSFAPAGGRGAPALPDALTWVPTLQLRGSAELSDLAELRLSALLGPDDVPEETVATLLALAEQWVPHADTPDPAPGRPTVRSPDGTPPLHELPSAERWKELVARAVADIRGGAFEKVVLAREVRATADGPFDLPAALQRLRDRYPEATVFAVGHGEHTFLGATPEYLLRLTGRTVHALGLAGTAPRGATPAQDAALAAELLDSPKIRREHGIVVRMLLDVLGPACAQVAADGPRVTALANVQHLATVVEGQGVHPNVGILELAAHLHPTPALGGHPRQDALRWLARHEGLARGWYAGTVGWSDGSGQGEFAVAIRSALVRGATASLYAGCGIVADSDPEAEYQESRAKLRPMLQALGLE